MITVYCVDINGHRFEKVFNDYWQARVFILRCQHGHRVDVLYYSTDNKDCDSELHRLVNYGY